jgi:hypothetical protein
MDGASPALKLLRKHLTALAPGEIVDIGKLTALLAGCWHEFDGTRRKACTRVSLPAWKQCVGSRRF